jgi:hypothetical protein
MQPVLPATRKHQLTPCANSSGTVHVGEVVDPRAAHIERFKSDNATLKRRVAERDAEIEALSEFKNAALSRLATQHEEIERHRRDHACASVRDLSTRRRGVIAPRLVNNRIDQP